MFPFFRVRTSKVIVLGSCQALVSLNAAALFRLSRAITCGSGGMVVAIRCKVGATRFGLRLRAAAIGSGSRAAMGKIPSLEGRSRLHGADFA